MQNLKLKIKSWLGLALSERSESKGFTLIELLVVMAIIGILAALTLTSFDAARKNARDTTRKSDLQQYRNALEAYASNNNGKYPTSGAAGQNYVCGDGTGSATDPKVFQSSGALIPNYLPSVILPPSATDCALNVYRYFFDGGGIKWTLDTGLETGDIWQVCSTGKAGKVVTGWVGDSNCEVP